MVEARCLSSNAFTVCLELPWVCIQVEISCHGVGFLTTLQHAANAETFLTAKHDNPNKYKQHTRQCYIFYIFYKLNNLSNEVTTLTYKAVDLVCYIYKLYFIRTCSFPDCFSIASYPNFPIITGMTAWAFLRTCKTRKF